MPWQGRMNREMPAREEKNGPSRTARLEREGPRAAETPREPGACDEPGGESFRFDDPYWDDAFDSYHDPTLRTCCRS